MADERFDAVVVGAGPAGTAAAYTMAKAGLSVVLLDRGEFPGAKNMFGGIIYRQQLEELIPGCTQEPGFPVERHITEQRYWLLGPESVVSIGHKHERFNRSPHNAWSAFRVKFDPWLAGKAEEAGALPIYQTAATGLIRDGSGRVVGVHTDRPDGDLHAGVVVIADGVNGLLAEQIGVHRPWRPDEVSLAVKEVIALPREKIEDRFNLEGDEGTTIEFLGATSQGMTGLGFLYTNRESFSLGIGVMVSDLQRTGVKPYELLESVKRHPMIRRLIAGGETKEYSAHLIPEGAWCSVPPLSGDGWVICGDAAQMVDFVHREGTNLAMASGHLAGEAVVEAKQRGDFSAASLAGYDRRVHASFIRADLKKIQRMPAFLHGQDPARLFDGLIGAMNEAAYRYFLVDGLSKAQAQRQMLRKLMQAAGGPSGALRLAWRGWRAMNA
ncbi:FAD-dependent oxidoreductase [Limnochorda pilosa]|uniref:Protein fixC n=1 Tax=Limnochorda pilosa TaxID=1555112 RepID=A0A0K2SKZ6_LIMPI|nr:FAD-dependent oxidoreductase [Limnochorda pilosa]BAS27791.1 protein fixC [Limnochorda pilosa]